MVNEAISSFQGRHLKPIYTRNIKANVSLSSTLLEVAVPGHHLNEFSLISSKSKDFTALG